MSKFFLYGSHVKYVGGGHMSNQEKIEILFSIWTG